MKRLYILFGLTLVCLSMPNVVWGRNCKPVGCSESGGNDDIVASTLKQEDASSRQAYCYVCEKGYCEDGDIVFLNDYSMFKSCNQSGGWHDDQWEIYAPAQCSKEVVKNKENAIYLSTNTTKGQDYINQLNLTEKKYNIVGTDYDGSSNNIFSSVVKKGTVPCMYYVCKNGYMPNSDKTECIADTRKDTCEQNNKGKWTSNECQCNSGYVHKDGTKMECIEDPRPKKCTNSGGNWSNDSCTCDTAKHLKKSGDECECKDGYEYKDQNDKSQGCKITTAEQNAQNARICKGSGGNWSNGSCTCAADKNLKKSGIKCECNDGYEYKDEKDKSKGCKITTAEQNAQNKNKCEKSRESGQPVKWDDDKKKCFCDGSEGQYNDILNTGDIYECKETENYKVCERLISQGVASWKYDRCVCNDKNKEFTGASCEYTQAFLNAQQADKLSKEIEKIGKTLDAVTDTFEISKWRNADGEFNTARLASDSVAAVVLGTAGGLISSKVIKKKQIEDGFEDIKCIIGSQTVADYGDEFQVGIQ